MSNNNTPTELYLTYLEAKVFAYILANPTTTATEISSKAKVSISVVYRALNVLKENNLLNIMQKTPRLRKGNKISMYSALFSAYTITIDAKNGIKTKFITKKNDKY